MKEKLDALFIHFTEKQNFPIIEYDQSAAYLPEAIIEDVEIDQTDMDIAQQLENEKTEQLPDKIHWSCGFTTNNIRRIELSLTISRKIRRSEINSLRKAVLELFE